MAATLLVLAGCVTTPAKTGAGSQSAQNETDPSIVPLAQEEAQQIAGKPQASRKAALAAPATPQAAATGEALPSYSELTASPSAPAQTAPNLGGIVLQSTGINASRASIFAAPTPAAVPQEQVGHDVPAYAPTSAPNPAANSIERQAPAGAVPSPAKVSQRSAGQDPRFAGLPFRRNEYIGGDDIPLAMAAKFYASNDLYTPSDRDDEPVGLMKLASFSGMARMAAHGLKIQRPDVEVGCFKPQLVNLIKSAERHFGSEAIVTSGYRDFAHNTRVGGAKRSLHMQCDAADIQLAGVSKWDLARFLRSQAGRGGVGTYCHTPSVHIDIGRPRDWNWRCQRNEV